jgi:hypothetical protein
LREHGDWFHVGCHNRAVQLRSLEAVDRATRARERATILVEDAQRRQTARQLRLTPTGPPPDACPLCVHATTTIDWRPHTDWIAVEGCPCKGFFVWAPLLSVRVHQLTAWDRHDVAKRIRALRASGFEAWVATADGTVTGPLVVRTYQPDRPTEA